MTENVDVAHESQNVVGVAHATHNEDGGISCVRKCGQLLGKVASNVRKCSY